MSTGFPMNFSSPALNGVFTSVDIAGLVADTCGVSASEIEMLVEDVCCRVVGDVGSKEAVAGEFVVRWRCKHTPFECRDEALVASLYTAFAAEAIYNIACGEVLMREMG